VTLLALATTGRTGQASATRAASLVASREDKLPAARAA
jgi:hypothetical protein